MGGRAQRLGQGHGFPLQVADGADPVGPEQLVAADVQAGQEQERVARVEAGGGQASRVEVEVEVAGGERLCSRLVSEATLT